MYVDSPALYLLDCWTSHSKTTGVLSAAIAASALLGRFSTRYWNLTTGISSSSATRALVRLGVNVGYLGVGLTFNLKGVQWGEVRAPYM